MNLQSIQYIIVTKTQFFIWLLYIKEKRDKFFHIIAFKMFWHHYLVVMVIALVSNIIYNGCFKKCKCRFKF